MASPLLQNPVELDERSVRGSLWRREGEGGGIYLMIFPMSDE